MKQDYSNIDYKKTNRQKSLSPKSKSCGWCSGCDANYLTSWRKCEVCGTRNGSYRLKKEHNA